MLLSSLVPLVALLAAPILAQDDLSIEDLSGGMDLASNQKLQLQELGVFKKPHGRQWRTADRFGPFCFTQKRSHFDGSTETFCQRYVLNKDYYKPGGPVIIQDNGENDSLSTGWFKDSSFNNLLAKELNALYVVLEHRYYGGSNVTEDLSTDNLRWLSNKEALADSAEFIRNFPVPEGLNLPQSDLLTPAKTPFIYVGGSYPGGRADWMRVHYPDLVWGSIGSSGVVHAQLDFPEYYGSIVDHGEPDCVAAITKSIEVVDKLLDDPTTNAALKEYFGYTKDLSNYNFGYRLTSLYDWQRRSWIRPTDKWRQFCGNVTAPYAQGEVNVTTLGTIPAALKVWADMLTGNLKQELAAGKTAADVVAALESPAQDVSLQATNRLWYFQTCTEFGYSQNAPRDPSKPRSISKYVTAAEYMKRCKQTFQPGKYIRIADEPDVSRINSLGDFSIAYDRMATVDGEWDPWRTMAVGAMSQPARPNTINRPYWIVPKGAHCWDMQSTGDLATDPEDIRKLGEWKFEFVKAWIQQFHDEKNSNATKPAAQGAGKGSGKRRLDLD